MMQKIWLDTFVNQTDFVIVVGENDSGRVEFNLKEYPHALFKGEIGSGKSVMLRCLLWQCIKKGAQAYIIDFNGDMVALRKSGIAVLNCYRDALNLLEKLNQEMQSRVQLFEQSGVKNLTEYNQMVVNAPLARIVLACDGVFDGIFEMMYNDVDTTVLYKIKSELFTLTNSSQDTGINVLLTMCEEITADKFDFPLMITTYKTGSWYSAGADIEQFSMYRFQNTDLNDISQQAPEEEESGKEPPSVILYSEMNNKIAAMLELSDETIDLYAAAYIRHLQAQLKRYEMKARDGNDATEQD